MEESEIIIFYIGGGRGNGMSYSLIKSIKKGVVYSNFPLRRLLNEKDVRTI